MKSDIRVDVSRCMAHAVGAEHGVAPEDLKEVEPRVVQAHEILAAERAGNKYGFYDLYKDKVALEDVKAVAQAFLAKDFENLVVLGIGGSALGTTALVTALKPPYYNLLTKRARGGHPRIFVMDNIDPATFAQMLRICPVQKTLFNVISKSGGTAETASQMLIVLDAIEKKLGKDAVKDHVVVTTNPRDVFDAEGKPVKNLLHPVVDRYGLTCFVVPYNVGGRFSVFSPVGMFPAAMMGMDIDAMCEGCQAMDARCSEPYIETNPAYRCAAIQYLADTKKGKKMSVMVPYSDALRDVADWYRQLWAESLGKRFSLDKTEVFVGQTPIKALGATDQHSQVQLYREGPNDKIFNIVEVSRFDRIQKIPEALPEMPEFDYLRGMSMNDLLQCELEGTVDALKLSKRPVIRIVLPKVDASTVAQLLYLLEVETAMAGRLYNVNTFDQPGVEEGKNIARELMRQRKEKKGQSKKVPEPQPPASPPEPESPSSFGEAGPTPPEAG